MRSQNNSEVSGLDNWARINERETTGGETCLGGGWHDGPFSFRLVDFCGGCGIATSGDANGSQVQERTLG